jgi:hypothetical protein
MQTAQKVACVGCSAEVFMFRPPQDTRQLL